MILCSRRSEVRAMLALGHWPAACSAELREHVESCHDCSAAVKFTLAMQADRRLAAPQLPSAELVWWRAQLRKKQTAMEQVQLPLRQAQIFAVGLSFCIALGLMAWITLNAGWGIWKSLATLLPIGEWTLMLVGAAALLLLAAVAVYLKLEAE
jgi:anti-sigma factor RsiW